jgi:hypothetical protein
VYADGWQNAAVNPMVRAEAEDRDASGEPYAVRAIGRSPGRIETLPAGHCA